MTRTTHSMTTMPQSTATLWAGGLAAMGMALCYISMAVIFFGILSAPQGIDTLGLIQYLQTQHQLISIAYSIGYLLFGVLLALVVQVTQQALPDQHTTLAGLADRFGGIWVMLMMATGMTYLLGLDRIFNLASSDSVQAEALYHSAWLVTNALGGGIESVAGLWVMLYSVSGLQQQQFSKAMHILGLSVGTFGILTVLHRLPYLTEAFGLLQLIWFVWLGVALIRHRKAKLPASNITD